VSEALDWQSLARAHAHPLALRILARAAITPDQRFSASELAEEFGEPLGNVSYHARALRDRGLLRPAGKQEVRGAWVRYYRIADDALARGGRELSSQPL
jgi:DNA-binding transcriptional ArsR family regulator